MPASIDSTDKGISIAVKYEKNLENSIEKIPNGTRMRYPDRTLYGYRSFMPSHERVLNHPVDEILDMDIFTNKSLLSEMGFQFAMVNSSAMPATYLFKDHDKERKKDWPLIVSDSGGFQLHSGAEEFLDPNDIVDKHNRACDIGIALDLPLPHHFQKNLLLRAAAVQKSNTAVFLKKRRKSLQILNVFHGSTFYMRQKYRDVVEDDSINRVALGGVKTLDLIPLILHAIFVITKGKKYEQYHVLGVSGLERWILLSYLGHKKIAKLITSDSSSYIQCGIKMQYFEPHRLLSTLGLGDYLWQTNANRTLHCSCPVCSMLKYTEALGSLDSVVGFRGVLHHNLFLTRAYLDEIWELGALSKGEIMSNLRPYFNPAKLKEIGLALQAVDMALQDGVEVAAKKYAPYLLDKFVGVERKGLYATDQQDDGDKKRFNHFDGILKRYEKFHA